MSVVHASRAGVQNLGPAPSELRVHKPQRAKGCTVQQPQQAQAHSKRKPAAGNEEGGEGARLRPRARSPRARCGRGGRAHRLPPGALGRGRPRPGGARRPAAAATRGAAAPGRRRRDPEPGMEPERPSEGLPAPATAIEITRDSKQSVHHRRHGAPISPARGCSPDPGGSSGLLQRRAEEHRARAGPRCQRAAAAAASTFWSPRSPPRVSGAAVETSWLEETGGGSAPAAAGNSTRQYKAIPSVAAAAAATTTTTMLAAVAPSVFQSSR
ncbi:hypothetical protein C2845_PM01G37630 [Panicum miliaceum]|uniref:Uncharacterized protein n=1 Tax=Panicum miliaceum TaxID=4540 RepID=A0A3L6TJW0_PANMI|nr:hypothetical protein C2845_PM01G37630 [Panicum miliaceum]